MTRLDAKLGPEGVLVAASGLAVGYGSTPVVRGIEFTLRRGETWFVCGPNGSGKTCLMLTVIGLLKPVAGEVHLAADIAAGRALGYVPQRFALPPGIETTAREVVDLGLGGGRRAERRRAVETALVALAAEDFGGRRFRQLSGGQRQRVLAARALARDPALLVLDEPCAGLDLRAERDLLQRLVARCREQGAAVLCVEHSIEQARRFADRAILVHDGVADVGSAAEVLAPERVACAFGTGTEP